MNMADQLDKESSDSEVENPAGPTRDNASSKKQNSGDLDASLNGSITSSAGLRNNDPARRSADSKPYSIPEDREIQEEEEEEEP